MLRSMSVCVLAAVALVPLSAAPTAAATSSARLQVAPMADSVWKNSATRRASRTTAVVAPRTSTVSPTQAYQDRVLALTNLERTSRGLGALSLSTCADGFAQRWAGSLLSAGVLSHQSMGPILSTCAASAVGENVAYGNVSADQLVAMWMGSAGHRANILNPTFNRIGVGTATSTTGRVYGVQVFLRA